MTIQTAHPLAADRQDGRLTCQNNRLTGLPADSFMDQRRGEEVRKESKEAL